MALSIAPGYFNCSFYSRLLILSNRNIKKNKKKNSGQKRKSEKNIEN